MQRENPRAQHPDRRAAVLKSAPKGDKSHSKPTFRRDQRTTRGSTTAPRTESAAFNRGQGSAEPEEWPPRRSRVTDHTSNHGERPQRSAQVTDGSHSTFQVTQIESRRRAQYPRPSHLIACNRNDCTPVTHPRLVTPTHRTSSASPGRPRGCAAALYRICGSLQQRLRQPGRQQLLGTAC